MTGTLAIIIRLREQTASAPGDPQCWRRRVQRSNQYGGDLRARIPPLAHRQVALKAAEHGVNLNRPASAKLAA